MSTTNLNAHLNNFASRCFRDVADRDYITARMCYRAGLISQFHWAALQAFEKYYKAILLYNRIKAKNVRHDLALAQKYAERAPFPIKLSASSLNLLTHLDGCGRFRYLETSYFSHGPKLGELDKAVWELRRYCRVLDYSIELPDKTFRMMLVPEVERNEAAAQKPPQEFHISGGALEAIVKKQDHPARAALIWQNAFYGSSSRRSVTVPMHFFAENSPLYLYPAIMDHVLEYIHIPKDVVDAYRSMSTAQEAS